jgi:hypothetical protein
MDTHKTFYETLAARTVHWIFLLFVCVIALFIPIVRSIHAIKFSVYLVFLLSALFLVKSIATRRAVVTLEANGMVLRGVRPGIWKLFQRWVVERIDDSSVNLIRVGYLRDKTLGGLVSYPPGEPSKGAVFQMFLWVKYNSNGRQMEIYYPHLKNVSGFIELINCLESRYGSKVEKSL